MEYLKIIAIVLLIVAIFLMFIVKRMFGYRKFVCPSCGAEFQYQRMEATTCPDCGALMEESHGISRQDYDGYHTNNPRL